MRKLEGWRPSLRAAVGRWFEQVKVLGGRSRQPVGRQVEDPELFISRTIAGTPTQGARLVARRGPASTLEPALASAAPSVAGEIELFLDPRHTLLVPEGTKIVGQVRAPALCLLGEIEGEVQVGPGPVVVGTTGRLDGSLHATGSLLVAGQVKGWVRGGQGAGIRCAGELDVACTGRILGDVACGTLRVRRGGAIDGRVCSATG